MSTRCIVLRITDYSESSYVLLLLSNEYGIFSAIAKGAKKPKNRFSSVFGLLNEFDGEFTGSPNSELWTVVEAKPIEFHLLNKKYGIIQLLSASAELYQQSIIHESEANDFYNLLEKYLKYLPIVQSNHILIFWRFLNGYFKLNGIPLNYNICPQCNDILEESLSYSYSMGGFLCKKCRKQDNLVSEIIGISSESILSNNESLILKRLSSIGNYINDVTISQTSVEKINNIFIHYLSFHFHKKFHLNSLRGYTHKAL